ncbi:MAG TPA: DUF192 domain-containing protein [Opitutaceae bacterium]|nr:DUF192 domain-containing protein [Opitutaceae bacterium]
MTTTRRLLATVILALAALAGGCKEDTPSPAGPLGAEAWFPFKIGDVAVKLQVAVRPMEVQQGLMHRPVLGDNEGMLFVYSAASGRSFWMRNVTIPLDIGFFSGDGELREVRAMNPLDESPVTSFSSEIQFAVEMNQGWYRANGIKPGAHLDMAALRAALEARGFDPRDAGVR